MTGRRSLYVLRHAKSDWTAESGLDHDRPLAARGTKAAVLVGRYLTSLDQAPDLVLCSSARRARETLELAREAGGWESRVEVVDALYGATPSTVLQMVRGAAADVERLMVVGHEPAFSELVGLLIGSARIEMPTAALARVDLHGAEWSDADFGAGALRWLVTPKLLLPGESL